MAAIEADRDFLSRQAALEQVQRDNPAVKKYVEFFLLFLIAIDLVALVLKLTHLLATGGVYERSAAALRAMDVVGAHRMATDAAVLMRRITLEGHAQQEADERVYLGDVQVAEAEPEAEARPARSPRRFTPGVDPVTD